MEHPSKHGELHQGLDYIIYLRYCINFNCVPVILKACISVWMFSLCDTWYWRNILVVYHRQMLGIFHYMVTFITRVYMVWDIIAKLSMEYERNKNFQLDKYHVTSKIFLRLEKYFSCQVWRHKNYHIAKWLSDIREPFVLPSQYCISDSFTFTHQIHIYIYIYIYPSTPTMHSFDPLI